MALQKLHTGISGFDEASGGGFPRGRASLIEGGTGCGKTVFMLQSLVRGPRASGETCVFVSFEESPDQIVQNAQSFGWDPEAFNADGLIFIDARPDLDLVRSGEFDLAGLLAVLEHKAVRRGATTIAFDAIDQLLLLAADDRTRIREIARLQRWLREHNLTALISAKTTRSGDRLSSQLNPENLQFMLDCAVILDHEIVDGISQRTLRIRKYRGSAFEENAIPLIIGRGGIDVANIVHFEREGDRAPGERVPTGISDLDSMLEGGFFRGSSVLLTGAPGTAKTTLSGAFASAACERSEKTLFVSFDSPGDEIVRNLASVGIDLQPHIDSDTLSMVSLRALQGSAESQLLVIRRLAEDAQARVIITDPLSALSKSGNSALAPSVAERLVDWAKSRDITVMCTSLVDNSDELSEATPLQVSTIADTWLHLTYSTFAGERNRGLSIIKSRGTAHSNQVRELLLSDDGVKLEQVYSAAGEVLMGAMRWEREREEAVAVRERESAAQQERQRLASEAAELEAQVALFEARLATKRREVETARERVGARADDLERRQRDMRNFRLGTRGGGEGAP